MINYQYINHSIDYYTDCGYTRIESPWTVSQAVSDITKPKDAKDFPLNRKGNKVLVASGEQSFLYLYLKGFLPKGSFQTVTPCFRDECFDALHTKYFIKNELIITDFNESTKIVLYEKLVEDALLFYDNYFPKDGLWIKRINHLCCDINFYDDELGSYGIRQCDFLEWIYGTGSAEPRMTMLMKKYELSPK